MDENDGANDWYRVVEIDPHTFAIGEPKYEQRNWSYLLNGESRTLLFDTGSYFADITTVVARLAAGRPVTALPSHMHYDHLGNVMRFDNVAVADLAVLRACADGKWLTPAEVLFLGSHEERTPPRIAVTEWLGIDQEIDLGGRSVRLVHTPGHSPDSVSLWEVQRRYLFAADFLYCGPLYAQTPGASLSDYLATTERLLAQVGGETRIFGAHGADPEGGMAEVPELDGGDLRALETRLRALSAAPPRISGAQTATFDVSQKMQIILGANALET